MENGGSCNSTQKESPKQQSSSFQNIESHHVDSVDKIQCQAPVTPITNIALTLPHLLAKETDAAISVARSNSVAPLSSNRVSTQPFETSRFRSISVKIPSNRITMEELEKVVVDDKCVNNHTIDLSSGYFLADRKQQRKRTFYSQPIDKSKVESGNVETPNSTYENQAGSFSMDRQRDKRYDSFKTWSGKLERQISNLRGKPQDPETLDNDLPNPEVEALPVARYFDALEGPELETLRDSEELVLPEDKKWPFLLRYPISSFGICLGISSQAILWKTLSTSPSTIFLHISPGINIVLWYLSVVVTAMVSFVYVLKIILYFEAVRREYYHPIRINFFFAPWISLMFLVLGMPSALVQNLHGLIWYMLMAPVLFLELKIYGQWMLGGERRLSKVANPSNHLSIVGNFVGALLGASMGLKEGPIFFFSVGIAHYIVLFVTLYQRLPTNVTLPKELHPVFFLFVAAPNVASMAWANIQGSFDYGSKIAYFIAMFLYISLAVRVNFFRGFKFSLAWWAYTFPMTGASIATIRYSCEVKNPITQSLAVLLSSIATLTVTGLFISTIIHAFVLQDLFPNDIAIAITEKRPKSKKRKANKKSENSESTDISISITL